ncbi:MAG: four helix bundle protein [Saprospiraceae bacterium]
MGNFKDLWVWKEGVNLAADIYTISKNGEFAKDYGLRNQIQRAVVSISSNISEGDERGSNRQSAYFFKIAKGSCAEVITQLHIAHRIGYIEKPELEKLEIKAMKISSGLYKMIEKRGGYNIVNNLKWLIISLFIPI